MVTLDDRSYHLVHRAVVTGMHHLDALGLKDRRVMLIAASWGFG
jgi:hypothetical protein